MSLSDYKLIGPVAYRGKVGCQDVRCTQMRGADSCYGWHCEYCDAPCSMMGHRCDASQAILGEARRVADEDKS